MSTQLWSVAEVGERLRISADQVYVLIDQGLLTPINVSTGKTRPRWRISDDNLASYIESQKQPAA